MPPREEVLAEISMLIDGSAFCEEEIDPYTLAKKILDLVEEKINSVDHTGNVIYRA
jgi:hypothetical protein